MTTPSHYEAINIERIKNRAPITKLLDKTVRFPERPKVDMAPTLYSPVGTLVQTASPRLTFAKVKRNNFVERYTKLKSLVPAPTAYNPEKAEKYVTIGARRSYK